MPSDDRRPGILALAMLTGLLVLADGALAALGLVIWNALWRGYLTSTEATTFLVLGGSATVGTLIYLLALLALARGPRAARLASGLAVLRAIAVIAALAAITAGRGAIVIVGPLETSGALVAVAEVLGAVMVTRVVSRRTRLGT